jgi:hypothetical protein
MVEGEGVVTHFVMERQREGLDRDSEPRLGQ